MAQTEVRRPARTKSPAFEVDAIDVAGARVVWCRGELDIAAEESVIRSIAVALGRPSTNMVLDLRELTFADCAVIRVVEYADAACARCQVSLYVDFGQVVRDLVATLEPELLGKAKPYLAATPGR